MLEKLILDGTLPTYILILVSNLMVFRLKIDVATKAENGKRERTNKNESTEVQNFGAIRIQLYHQCFEQV